MAVPAAGAPIRFEQLLVLAGLPQDCINTELIRRVFRLNGHVALQALLERDPAVAMLAYRVTMGLPLPRLLPSAAASIAPAAAPAEEVPAARPSAPGGQRSFEQLLVRGGLAQAEIDAGVVPLARIKYGQMVHLAVTEGNPDLAVRAYNRAKRLPSKATVERLQKAGYLLGEMQSDGSDLLLCFKDDCPRMLKCLTDSEAARAQIFHAATAGEPVPNVTPFELVDSPSGKLFMIMPKYAASLEVLPCLSPGGVPMLWACMSQALEGLHAKRFAHGDVKPSNICLTEDGKLTWAAWVGWASARPPRRRTFLATCMVSSESPVRRWIGGCWQSHSQRRAVAMTMS